MTVHRMHTDDRLASPSSDLAAAASSTLRSALDLLRLILLLPVLAVSAVLLHRKSRGGTAVAPAWSADDALWDDAHRDVTLTVVIPFYNPGDAMRPTVQRLVDGLREEGVGFEVVAVSDGSTDGSEKSLDGIGEEVRVIVNPVNRGKGAALHTGFAHARGRYVGMVDADGDIDPLHLADYLHRARLGGHQVVYADKRLSESASASSPFRKLVSFGFSSVVGSLFALGVSDTQTGCKLFRREALAAVLPRLREERFAFDLEFFVAAKAAGITRLHAAPVNLGERLAGSTVTARTILRTLGDALTVFARLHLTSAYRGSTVRTGSDERVVLAPVIALPAPRTSPELVLAA